MLAEVKDGDGGDAELWLRPGGKGSWSRLSRLQDKAVEGECGIGMVALWYFFVRK